MLILRKEDTLHKAWMYRVLIAVCDDAVLPHVLAFKGGTCAAMRGLLDRFSVDLDFDLVEEGGVAAAKERLERIFERKGLTISDSSKIVPQYFLKYPTTDGGRNTLKVEVTTLAPKANTYEMVRLEEIDRIVRCHTTGTMFANKMVALIDRFERHGSVAGRDVYDIHTFFLRGFSYDDAVIIERRGTDIVTFLHALERFIVTHITQTTIDQDLNTLLVPEEFLRLRKILKDETLMLVRDEITRREQASVTK